jgi:Mg2+/Co2+ transporter CorB
MNHDLGLTLAAIFFLVVVSAFLTGTQAALSEASRTRLGEYEKRGIRRAGIIMKLLDEEARTLSALHLGKLMTVIAASVCSTLLFTRYFTPPEALIAGAVIIAGFALFGIVFPRTFAISRPEHVAVASAHAIRFAVAVLGPITDGLDSASQGLLRIFGLKRHGDTQTVHEELREAIDIHIKEGTVVKNDRDMLGGILAMQDLEVSDIMVHRTRMTMIDGDENPKDIVALVLKSGHTRIPVWKETPDNIIGVLHAKNLFAALQKQNGDASKVNIEDILSPPWFVPDTRAIPDQLNAFLRRKSHFAIVVDEYGEVQGLVTLEDIIEEIVGDIKDEHDAVASGVRPKPDGSYLVDGGVAIRDLNRAFDWNLPDDEANTIAGLVIHEARMIPDVGQAFSFHGFRFEILKKRKHQVTAIRMSALKRDGDESSGG